MAAEPEGPLALERMTWPEVQATIDANLPLVLPVGSLEQHGPHLPLGTDAFVPVELARRLGGLRRLVLAPPLFYAGYSRPRSGGGRTFPGSIGVPGRLLEELVAAVAADLFRQGFRRMVVLNGHFENAPALYEAIERTIEPFARTHKALLVNWWDPIIAEDLPRIFPDGFPGWEAEHAGVVETSLMEELLPEYVRVALKADGGAPRVPCYDIFPPPPDIIAPSGVLWKSTQASREIGAYMAEALVARLAAILDAEFPTPDEQV
jgi:creatinine amidohydrolase